MAAPGLSLRPRRPWIYRLSHRASACELAPPARGVHSCPAQEMDLFESMAKELGVSLEGIEPSPVCHAYNMFLLATAHTRSFAESFSVLYGAEKAYFDSWNQ